MDRCAWCLDSHSSVYSVLCSMEHRGPRMSMLKIQKVMLDLSQWGALLFTWWVALCGERTLDSSNCHCNCTCEIEVGACPPAAVSWGWELCKAVLFVGTGILASSLGFLRWVAGVCIELLQGQWGNTKSVEDKTPNSETNRVPTLPPDNRHDLAQRQLEQLRQRRALRG